ncbi:unnamed protein product, partial [Larinioides sclopetarius]
MKKKEKTNKALLNVKTCKDRLNVVFEILKSELKCMHNQLEKIAKAYPKEQEVMEVKPSDIVATSRKLFSSFVEARQNNLHLMDVELGLLLAKENSLISEQYVNPETTDIMRTDVLESCKDLVIGSIDIKMKEVDEISSSLDTLNDIEKKIESQLSQLDSEETKASYTKLEKVKDAVSTCKKLSVSAYEKAKRGLKEADKELRMLKDVLDVVEESVVSATCTYLLKSNIEHRESEIYALTKAMKTMVAGVNNLEVTEEDIENYLNTRDPEAIMPEILPSTPLSSADRRKSAKVLFSDVETREDSSEDDNIDEQAQYMNFEVSSSNVEEIRNTLGFMKDSKVFDICQSVIFQDIEMLKTESQAAANDLKNLEKVNIKEITSDLNE